jgi:hypothetical protein
MTNPSPQQQKDGLKEITMAQDDYCKCGAKLIDNAEVSNKQCEPCRKAALAKMGKARTFVQEWLWDCRPYGQERATDGMPWDREYVADAAQMLIAFAGQSAASRDQALDDAAEAVKVAYKDYCTLPEAESRARYGTAVLQDMLVAAIKAGQSVPAAVSRDQIIDEVIAEARRVGIHEPLSLQDDPYIRGSIDAQQIVINALLALKTKEPTTSSYLWDIISVSDSFKAILGVHALDISTTPNRILCGKRIRVINIEGRFDWAVDCAGCQAAVLALKSAKERG